MNQKPLLKSTIKPVPRLSSRTLPARRAVTSPTAKPAPRQAAPAPKPAAAPTHRRTLDKVIAELEAALHEELAINQRLLGLIERKQQALSDASRTSVRDLTGEENTQLQLLAETAKRRMALVGEATLLVLPVASEPLNMRDLAERLAEPARGRLLVLRQQLRDRMQEVRQRGAVAQQATQSLVAHMQGLMQTIGRAMTGSPTYSRRGTSPKPAAVISTFQMTG